MNMQDKEFDDLLRAKLNNFEIEPSAHLWQNIDAGLDGKNRKKSVFPVLRIAASIIILITAGILFIPERKVVKPGKTHKNNAAVNKAPSSTIKTENNAPADDEQAAQVQMVAKQIVRTHQPGKKTSIPVAHNIQDTGLAAQTGPVKPDEQPVLAVVSQKIDKTTDAAIETIIAVKQSDVNEMPTLQTQPVLASAKKPPVEQSRPVAKKHGIRNFGDLVNMVVAKVDKRKDKIIEFTETDDDETTITGLHIGAIRIKKDN